MVGFIDRFLARYDIYRYPGYYKKFDYWWAMVIDLDRCTGCGACVTACQAENNTPVVGENESSKGRVLNWIRIERYIEGDYPNVKVKFIPILCQQCDKAPCEVGCPVYATYHNQDGLNVQVYNRCVGTFTCATYCPYDVRRFNWFTYNKRELLQGKGGTATSFEPPLDQQLNPDLSVREMGVMEKCTFCIQRIRAAKDTAKDEKREVKDGEIYPACVQTCPAKAMTFGDLNDPNSMVSKLTGLTEKTDYLREDGSRIAHIAKNPRTYRLLEDVNVFPKVFYLKRVMNDDSSRHNG